MMLQRLPNYLFAGSGKTAAYFLFECGEDVEDKEPKFFSVRNSLINMNFFCKYSLVDPQFYLYNSAYNGKNTTLDEHFMMN